MGDLRTLECARRFVAAMAHNTCVSDISITDGRLYLDAYEPCRDTRHVHVVEYTHTDDSGERVIGGTRRYAVIEFPPGRKFGGVLVTASDRNTAEAFYIGGWSNRFDSTLISPMYGHSHRDGNAMAFWGGRRMVHLHLNHVPNPYPVRPTRPTPEQLACLARLRYQVFIDHVGSDDHPCDYSGTFAGPDYALSLACPRCGETGKVPAVAPEGTPVPESADAAHEVLEAWSLVRW